MPGRLIEGHRTIGRREALNELAIAHPAESGKQNNTRPKIDFTHYELQARIVGLRGMLW